MGLYETLGREILVFDGATGTMLQSRGLPAGMAPETWCLEKPEEVRWVHKQYVDAGAQVLETNTLGATPIRLSHYGLEDKVREINVAAVRIAREAAEGKALVAASMGPLGTLLEPLGALPFDEAYTQFAEQAKALAEAKPDFIIIETIADLNEMRAAIMACKENAPGIKVIAQMTLDETGRSFTGTDPETAGLVMQSLGADVIGFNCSVGPAQLVDAVKRISKVARVAISVQPNAGMPHLQGGRTVFPMGPEEFASYGPKLIEAGASVIGGCCGTTPEHIKLLRKAVSGLTPERCFCPPLAKSLALASRTQTLFFADSNLPIPIGERLNPTGKKALSRDIKEASYTLVRREAKAQVTAGAKMLDVNVGVPLIDEAKAMGEAVRAVQEAVSVPLCIDSASPKALEAGLKAYVGKALVNSFSLEEGRAEAVLPVAKRFGAAVIGLTIDENGIPSSAEERLHIARRLVKVAGDYGIPPWDVVIDPLALTAGAQQSQALETLRSICALKFELGCRTSLGVSNVSFGLPNRGFLNATYLSMAITAGLDMAIVNPMDERMMDTIKAARVLMGRDENAREYISMVGQKKLVHNENEVAAKLAGQGRQGGSTGGGQTTEPARSRTKLHSAEGQAASQDEARVSPSGTGVAHERARQTGEAVPVRTDRQADHPFEPETDALRRRLYDAVLEGDKGEILPLVEESLSEGIPALDILNGSLIPAIDETGRLFGAGIYFLPQLMLSAETMKMAFDRLKPELAETKSGQDGAGVIVLATVQGDVHDIGKNLVAVLLENHGFTVHDLGRDVKPKTVLQEARRLSADLVCLSALMTTTMPKMKDVIDLFAQEGFDCPVIVGGAATTKSFANEIGAAGYGRDAQEAVTQAKKVLAERVLAQKAMAEGALAERTSRAQ